MRKDGPGWAGEVDGCCCLELFTLYSDVLVFFCYIPTLTDRDTSKVVGVLGCYTCYVTFLNVWLKVVPLSFFLLLFLPFLFLLPFFLYVRREKIAYRFSHSTPPLLCACSP